MYIYIAPPNGNPSRKRIRSTFIWQCIYALLNKKVFSLALNSVRDSSLSRILHGNYASSKTNSTHTDKWTITYMAYTTNERVSICLMTYRFSVR